MHRNTQFRGHVIDLETKQQGPIHLHPEPCVFYGTASNFSQPNIHSIVPAPRNHGNFKYQYISEHRNSALLYGMTQYNAVQHQPPASHLNLAVTAPSSRYNSYVAPPFGIRDFPFLVNHGVHDQLSLSSTHRIVGIPSENYRRIIPYADGVGGSFKRKNAGFPGNYYYHNALAGPSSFPSLRTSRPSESNAASFLPPEDAANMNGPYVEAGNIGVQGYHMTATNRSSTGFLHSSMAQGHPHLHHPPPPVQGVRRYNNNFLSQVATSSHRTSTISSSNTGVSAIQNVADAGLAFAAPALSTGFQLYEPYRRELVLDPNARHHNLLHLRVLPEDEVAMLDIPGYNEAGDSIDRHWDMRLDVDHMSYEELLVLGEQIGIVGTGLCEEAIQNNLRTRTFTSSATCTNIKEPACLDQNVNLCIICQTDYEDRENIGILDCGHECHGDCIKKWLLVRNTCPICKSTALVIEGKDML